MAAFIQLGMSARLLLPGRDTQLQTTGLYRISRNPIYFGIHTSWIGLTLIVFNIWTVVGVSLFFLNQHFRIKREEEFLEERFGEEYRKYEQRVGRYFWKI